MGACSLPILSPHYPIRDTPPPGTSAITDHDQAPRLALGTQHMAHHIDPGAGAAMMAFATCVFSIFGDFPLMTIDAGLVKRAI